MQRIEWVHRVNKEEVLKRVRKEELLEILKTRKGNCIVGLHIVRGKGRRRRRRRRERLIIDNVKRVEAIKKPKMDIKNWTYQCQWCQDPANQQTFR